MASLRFRATLARFFSNRWLVLVAAMWIQSCGGIGYLFGSISPVIKSSMGYNQRELASVSVAKNIGGSVGFLAGAMCEVLPLWGALLMGSVQTLFGYGLVWMVVTGLAPVLPLWAMCALIFIANNGETYINTAALVSGVQNFPESRGPVVGLLKGFAGLGGAILSQIYATMHPSQPSSMILMVAVGPPIMFVAVMFFIRPIGGSSQIRPSDGSKFRFIYSVCLVLAAYLMAVMLVEDLIDLSQNVYTVFSITLLAILAVPLVIPLASSCISDLNDSLEETFLSKNEVQEQKPRKGQHDDPIIHVSDIYSEEEVNCENRGALPQIGEEFTMTQALMTADLWLIFFSLQLGSGSGLTVIDNLGQMSESLGYDNTHVFVSMFSVWSFLGRIGGGYLSEKIVRDRAYPRPIAMAIAQLAMVFGHLCFAFKFPGEMYIGTLLVGLSYGAHWGIVPAIASELFGLKKFGALYNFLTLANPAGSLVFSGLIASGIYDGEAEKQAHGPEMALLAEDGTLKCEGSVCFFLTSLIMSGFCAIAAVLSLILVRRTKSVYAHLYPNKQNLNPGNGEIL